MAQQLLSEAIKEKEFDIRMINRNVVRGSLARQDVEKNEKKLPDDSANADFVSLESFMEKKN